MATKSKELSIEDKLWKTADALRGSMDASEYRNVVLGLIFLKYVSDSFVTRHNELLKSDYTEDAEARWELIQQSAKTPQIGEIIDSAMDAIEKSNDSLRGVLSKNYASPDLDKTRLGEVVDLISDISLGDKHAKQSDILGRVYEYFLNEFASQEGKRVVNFTRHGLSFVHW